MRIAVIGVGGIGGYFGALLARGGHDVSCVARGANLEAIAARGLDVRVSEPNGSFVVPCAAFAPGQAPPAELVVIAVKSYDTAAAVSENGELLARALAVLPLQNGIDHLDVLDAAAGRDKVLGAVARGSIHRVSPGVIQCDAPGWMVLGPRFPGQQKLARTVWQAMVDAGVSAELVDDIAARMWWKLCWNASFNSLTAVLGAPVGPVLDHPATYALVEAIIRETMAVAAAEGVDLPADTLVAAVDHGRQLAHIKTSMQVDAERGRRLEHEALTGSVVRRGRKHGISTPLAATIDALLAFRSDLPGRVPR